mgnify:CR=1 FL=1|tara:strand:+ start:54 stop:557 length:504 start_codon:yes stop_codon:yes gene_type:complete
MNYTVLQRVHPFLDLVSFTRLQQTNTLDYQSTELWDLYRTTNLPKLDFVPTSKKAVAFHYLMQWALRLPFAPLTFPWFQAIVDWLQYKCSIHLIHQTMFRDDFLLFSTLQFHHLKWTQCFLWEKLKHRHLVDVRNDIRNDLYILERLEKRYRYAGWHSTSKRPLLCF